MLDTFFTVETENLLFNSNARDYLNFKVESSKALILHQLKTDQGDLKDLILQNKPNPAIVLFKLLSNEVTSDFNITFSGQRYEELEKSATIFFLDSKRKEEHFTDKKIHCTKVVDKNIALLIQFRVPLFCDLSSRDLGKLHFSATFHKSHGQVHKAIDQLLFLEDPSYLKLEYNSYSDYYNLQLSNLMRADLKIDLVTVQDQTVLSGLDLASQESYSLIHDNSSKQPVISLKMEYSFPKDRVLLYPCT